MESSIGKIEASNLLVSEMIADLKIVVAELLRSQTPRTLLAQRFRATHFSMRRRCVWRIRIAITEDQLQTNSARSAKHVLSSSYVGASLTRRWRRHGRGQLWN